MDEETSGLHIIFVCVLLCILFLTYHAVPSKVVIHKKQSVSFTTDSNAIHKIKDSENASLTKPIVANEQKDALVVTDMHLKEDKNINQPRVDTDNQSKDISVIPMNNPGYKSHKKGIVIFTHQKHVDEYKIGCQDCHHDKNGTPLQLTYQDTVQDCIECHPGTLKPKGEKLDKKPRIMKYHFEALHANCKGCHKKYNITKGDPKGKGPAPISCNKCHPKK